MIGMKIEETDYMPYVEYNDDDGKWHNLCKDADGNTVDVVTDKNGIIVAEEII